ncbi:MAG: bifunctional diaminohydroxyphosphoribosylaminopyrimidine deaminase/5-amino-6-(5-phosphoribosylamino)uracil reductase RibD [Myxococcales bacterium]|nr:bifunctional diaminohydroxyphosphoribosylaminopyrimidine deaminase/5-amino-6-(5-phosphoribosylamino)uracil reductase RibD [Myxococcales bacterium]MCB9524139.1 bifunctional diaminohydroxyphosphoribosylaminopyrimidine deaminase/5-amino-6-(5-phosphoribosylamino)uracil reductase RibD [Myxococcales bacterium]
MSDRPPQGWMAEALALIHASHHRTRPNPKVGCVIVRDGRIVGRGVSAPAGGPHAEVYALAEAGAAARGADMYVTLEPCCHHGRTPPCTDAILAAGVGRVFVGVRDPNPKVDGGGIAKLEAAGVPVAVGLMPPGHEHQHAPFARYILDGRPWVQLKAAVSLDGRIATAAGDSKWITGPAARADAHALRAAADAVLVGSGTARADDPALTVRLAPGSDPLRVVLDARGELPLDLQLMGPNTRLYHGPDVPADRVRAWGDCGVTAVAAPLVGGRLDLPAVLADLARTADIVRLMVEGGGRLHGALLQAGLADEAVFYVAPRFIGEGRPVLALPSPPTVAQGWRLEGPTHTVLDADVRIRGRIVYGAPPTAPADGGH